MADLRERIATAIYNQGGLRRGLPDAHACADSVLAAIKEDLGAEAHDAVLEALVVAAGKGWIAPTTPDWALTADLVLEKLTEDPCTT